MDKKIDLGGNTFAEKTEDGIRIYYEKGHKYLGGNIDFTLRKEIIKLDRATLQKILNLTTDELKNTI